MDELLEFLQSQELLVLASKDGEMVWIANVYYVIDEHAKMYFISSEETNHCQQILENPHIAFSIAWYNPRKHADRKAIQGRGLCSKATNEGEIRRGVKLHNQRFPEFAEDITTDWIKNNDNDSHVWVVTPTYIKFWNDQLYGEEGTKEFPFQ